MKFNTAQQVFPTNIIAGMFNFKDRGFAAGDRGRSRGADGQPVQHRVASSNVSVPTLKQTFYELEAQNRRNTVLLVLVFLGLVGVLGFGFDWFFLHFDPSGQRGMPFPIGTLGALVFGGIYSLQGYYFGASQVLAASSARPAKRRQPGREAALERGRTKWPSRPASPHPRRTSCPTPTRTRSPLAGTPGTRPSRSRKGCSTRSTGRSCQGVVSHEMSHVRNYDIRSMTLVTALFGAATLMADMSRRGLYFGAGGRAGAIRATAAAGPAACSSSSGSCSPSSPPSWGRCSYSLVVIDI